MIKAEVLAHSVAYRATKYEIEAITMRVTMPRIILAEFNTHRRLSKNTSSSRAIPITKMIKHVLDNMFFPTYWGANRSGMQATEELTGIRLCLAKLAWKTAGITATLFARTLNKIGVHKQITNRLIENFSYVTVIFTASDLLNFLALRHHPDAQPEIYRVAEAISDAWLASRAKELKPGEWHLPLVTEHDKNTLSIEDQKMVSAARCASTSYQTVDGKPITVEVAYNIAQKLIHSDPIHASPFEHQLTPDELVDIEYRVAKSKKKLQNATIWKRPDLHGNTRGFVQHRKTLSNNTHERNRDFYLTFG